MSHGKDGQNNFADLVAPCAAPATAREPAWSNQFYMRLRRVRPRKLPWKLTGLMRPSLLEQRPTDRISNV